ncbi:MAG: MBL fold metallo-hydrolase [Candidatus Poribacteria bacterium]|nr:MBL fold metallo-hydrolase [Candidatus Poribacteria bacterium]
MTNSQTKVTFLGTASAVPTAGHDTASFIINGKYLVDTGWNAAIRMLEHGFNPMNLEYLFFTHCHHDHYLGLPHLLFYLRMRQRDRPDRPPLKVVGPAEDTEKVISLAHRFLQTDRFPQLERAPDIIPLTPGESYEEEAFHIDTSGTIHPVQGLCYKFTDKRSGAVFAFTGDTAYHAPIAEHVKGVPFLIHEASFGPDNPAPGSSSGHSGAPQAATIAQAAGVDLLALIHCSEQQSQAALVAARRIFPNTIFPADGQTVTLMADGVVSAQ